MKRILALIVVLLLAFGIYWFFLRSKQNTNDGPKQAPIGLKKHSVKFNNSVNALMGSYFDIKNALVEEDTVKAKQAMATFIRLLDSIPLNELKNDTAMIFETAQGTLSDIRSNAASLLEQTNITEMRHDFSMVTEMMYPSFFKTINYEGPSLYILNCPMAFGEDKGANWISNTEEVVNPYLGKHHPEYKATMLHCGEVKDSIKSN